MSVDVARRIQREHNRLVPPEAIARAGGVLAFSRDGDLLYVWPDDHVVNHERACPCPMHLVVYRFRLRGARVAIAEVRAFLAAASGEGPERTTADLYGATPRRPLEEAVR